MISFIAIFMFAMFLSPAAFGDCKDCMAECPHATKDIKECDSGCKKVCKPDECIACMAECPHKTKDLKECDRGCPSVCTTRKGTCVGRAQFDMECTKFTSEEMCLNLKDRPSCRWTASTGSHLRNLPSSPPIPSGGGSSSGGTSTGTN